jgi:hypothetical protein
MAYFSGLFRDGVSFRLLVYNTVKDLRRVRFIGGKIFDGKNRSDRRQTCPVPLSP